MMGLCMRISMTVASIALLGLLVAGGIYLFHSKLKEVEERVQHLVQQKAQIVPPVEKEEKEELPAAGKEQLWSAMQTKLKNAVVQVFSQVTEFNWIEPYKTPTQSESAGTAFFISSDGDLITNAHVVEQALVVSIQIPASGKRRFEVDVLGVSPERDLALLRVKKKEMEVLKREIHAESLPFLKLGDSDAVLRGDKIMALGYPLGQQGLKSTTGVVSGREHLMGQYFIQISAPINAGNSGGPSLDNKGRVVGINSAGVPSAQNVGYIIPINEVKLFLDQLKTMPGQGTTKLLRKPYLGIWFGKAANEDLVAYLGNPPPGGLYVVDVYKGSPFDKAGIKAGDMIYTIDGYAVDMYGEMSVPWSKEDRISIVDYVARLKLGHMFTIAYYRQGKLLKASVKLESIVSPIRLMYPGYEKIDYEVLAGLVIMPITLNHVYLLAKYAPELMQYADQKKQMKPALLITHVMHNSPASRARTIGAGGIISEVNGQKVHSLEEFRTAIAKHTKGSYVTIKTTDNQFVALPIGEILGDEPLLESTYFYKPSQSFTELKRHFGKMQIT